MRSSGCVLFGTPVTLYLPCLTECNCVEGGAVVSCGSGGVFLLCEGVAPVVEVCSCCVELLFFLLCGGVVV